MGYEFLRRLAQVLGEHRTSVQKALQVANLCPEDLATVQELFLEQLQNEGFDINNLPTMSIHPESQTGEEGIMLGNLLVGDRVGRPLYQPIPHFNLHLIADGKSGSGKSLLINWISYQLITKADVKFWGFSGEFQSLGSVLPAERLWILDVRQDRDNFLEPPPGVHPMHWLNRIQGLFREQYLRDGATNLLQETILNLYRSKGVLDGGRNYPTLLDLNQALDRMEYKPTTRHAQYLESARARCKALELGMGETFRCVRGFDLATLLDHSIVFNNLNSMSDPQRLFYVTLKTLRVECFRERNPVDGLQNAFGVDEAHLLYNRTVARRQDFGELILHSQIRTMRKHGVGYMFADQVPSQLPPSVFANIGTHISRRTHYGPDILAISRAMNLTEDQAAELPRLDFRKAIMTSPEYPEPVRFQVPDWNPRRLSGEEIKQRMEPVLSGLAWVPYRPEAGPDLRREAPKAGVARTPARQPGVGTVDRETSDLLKRVLKDVNERPYLNLQQRSKQSLKDIGPSVLSRLVRTLGLLGLAQEEWISFHTRGSPSKFLCITERGAEFLGVPYKPLAGKGSLVHRVFQHCIKRSLERRGRSAVVEYSHDGKSVDVCEARDDGTLWAYEVELEASENHVITNIERDLQVNFARVFVVVRTPAALKEVQGKVYRKLNYRLLDKVSFCLIREFRDE